MDSSETGLDRIEAQRSTDVSQEQQKRRYFPMNLINNGLRTLSSRGFLQAGGEGTTPPSESEPEFFINLKLSDLFDIPGEYVPMNTKTFSAVSDGNEEYLEKMKNYETPMACFKSDQGDSVLHLAAAWGHLELVKSIVCECPCLLLEPNSKDQLPLHVAARDGHSAVVEALVATLTFVSGKLSDERPNLYVLKDIDGHTPLHLAFKGRYMEIASSLVKANQQASFLANKDKISPLYLAAEAGDVSLLRAMLGYNGREGRKTNLDSQLEGRKYLAHAALMSMTMSTDTLDVILNEYPSLVDERDGEGRTCLSFAASLGFYGGVRKLLDRSTDGVYECDEDGSFPIHVATKFSRVRILDEILKRCPDSKHLLNKQGQNILHVAANSMKFRFLRGLARHEETMHLANEQDVDGNTPLHLATIKWRPRVAQFLVRRKNLLIQNNNGLTALDIAELNLQPHYIFRERLTVMALAIGHALHDARCMHTMKLTRPSMPLNREGNKEYINALIVVAALVATVTFAASFTLPGGFKSSSPNLGMANLVTDFRLVIFLIYDVLAMQCSIVAVVSLIWAQLGDPALFNSSLDVALPALLYALMFMAYAFFFATVIAAGHVIWLIVVLVISSLIFMSVMALILTPHYFLQQPALRAASGKYLIGFVLLVNDDDDASNQTSAHKSVVKRAELESVEKPDTS